MTDGERRQAIHSLRAIVEEIEKYSSAYFWTPASNAQTRKSRKFTTEIEVSLGADVVTFGSDYYETSRNCYYIKDLRFNGQKTTTKLIKNIIVKLQEMDGGA